MNSSANTSAASSIAGYPFWNALTPYARNKNSDTDTFATSSMATVGVSGGL